MSLALAPTPTSHRLWVAVSSPYGGPDGVQRLLLFDCDSYRFLCVERQRRDIDQQSIEAEGQEGQGDVDKSDAATCRIVRSIINGLPYDAGPINVSLPGLVLREWRGDFHGQPWYTYYPSVAEYQLRCPVPTLLRSQLDVVGRINYGVDKVIIRPPHSPRRVCLFRYHPHAPHYGGVWAEIHILTQLPYNHPHILAPGYLVVEEISGLGVVGFISRLPADVLCIHDPSLPLKLKWLRQLMSLVDELHVDFGIVHQHIVAQNLLVNRTTDCILLVNFARATGTGRFERPGYENELGAQNDIKGVVILAYYLVTRDPKYHSYNLASIRADDAVCREK